MRFEWAAGGINVYWQHEQITPHNVRVANYGDPERQALIPEVGDVIKGFPGYMDEPITVRVTHVEKIGQGCTAYLVSVTTVKS
jgi:hypothetical protein